MDNFYCDIEAAQRVCLLYVRYIHGRDLAKPAPKGSMSNAIGDYREAASKPKNMYRRKSEATYPSHAEVSQYEYRYLQSLLSKEAFVCGELTESGIAAINAEDTNEIKNGKPYRMPYYREKQLRRAYRRIAREFKNGRYPWDKWNRK